MKIHYCIINITPKILGVTQVNQRYNFANAPKNRSPFVSVTSSAALARPLRTTPLCTVNFDVIVEASLIMKQHDEGFEGGGEGDDGKCSSQEA